MTPLPETLLYREPWWLVRLIRYSPVFLSLQVCVHCILVHLRWHWLPSQWQVCLVTKSSSSLIRLNFVASHVWERMFSSCSLSMHWYTNGLYVWLQFCPQSLVMLSCPISQLVTEQLRLHMPSGSAILLPSLLTIFKCAWYSNVVSIIDLGGVFPNRLKRCKAIFQ